MSAARALSRLVARRIPTVNGLWALIAVVVPITGAFLARMAAIDLAYQIRAGGIMLDTHRLLDVDTFTFTILGHPWLNQQWGAEVLLAAIYRSGGWGGIALVRGLLLGCTMFFLYRACRAAGGGPRASACLSLAGWLVGIQLLPELRPQQFGFLLFAAVQWIVATRRGSPHRLWLVPILVAAWANLHGSFPLALVLLGFASLEDRRKDPAGARRAMMVMGASLVATLLNPFGVRVWSYVVELSTNPVVSQRISEWQPPSIHTPTGALFFTSLLAATIFLARSGRSVGLIALLKLGGFGALGLLTVRGVAWWGLVAPVVVAGVLPGDGALRPADRSPLNATIAAALLIATGLVAPIGRGTDPVTGGPAVLTYAPESLVSAAREVVPTGSHVFVSQLYASWSEFSAPALAVAVDPRIELFPASVWADYASVSDGQEGWARILDEWQVNALVLDPGQSGGLLAVIGDSPEWRRIRADPSGFVYVRSDVIPA
ncbi:MAG: hypothetical protein ABI635_00835 [Actinomycetota bacterium]